MKLLRNSIPILLMAGCAAAQPAPAPAPAPLPRIQLDDDVRMEAQEAAEEARDIAAEAGRMAIEGDLQRLRGFAFAQAAPVPPMPPDMSGLNVRIQRTDRRMNEDRLYDSGQGALDNHRYDEALEYFSQAAARGGPRADGADYWKAYSLVRLGRRAEALAALAELRKSYPSSRWLDDAKALEMEAGKPVNPESESDEDLKLIALNGLMQSDPDRALPLLANLLKGNQSPRIQKRAVYVLAASSLPKAQQLLEQVARGSQGNPDVQLAAIRYLGQRRNQPANSQLLGDVYSHTADAGIKRAILEAFASSRDYQRLLQLAKAEHDPRLREFAIQCLGGTRAADTGDALAAMYAGEADQDAKVAIIDALSGQHNAKALVQAARAEKDPKMKQRIVERLAGMKSPEATDYLMEILK